MSDITTPVLIYAPGLGRYTKNSADAVADVLARTMDMVDRNATYGTKSDPEVAAPRGLRVAKTIVDGLDKPVLQLFELDYMSALEPSSSAAGPSVVPGIFRSTSYSVLGGAKWWAALRRPAKSRRAKAQLFVGLICAGALIFAALVAIYAALVTMGVDLPAAGIFGEEAAPWTFGVTSLGLVITWAALRRHILALAATTERMIRFVRNDDTAADTSSGILTEALDGLWKNGWKGPVHLFGYSFGSLVMFEAMYPREASRLVSEPVRTVTSLVTVGCPLDIVRLYAPSFTNGRVERRPELEWTNVFNRADIFASNLKNGDDTSEGLAEVLDIGARPTSYRYLDEELSWFRIFSSGRTHSSYWGTPDRANCFQLLAPIWVPSATALPQPGDTPQPDVD